MSSDLLSYLIFNFQRYLHFSFFQIRDHKFLCPNNTIFDQQNLICASWWDTECKESYSPITDPWATPPDEDENPSADLDSEDVYLYYDDFSQYEELKNNHPSSALIVDPYEYDEYYETAVDDVVAKDRRTGRSKSGASGRGGDFDNPPIARSVSHSSSTSLNSHIGGPAKGYVISTQFGSQSTIKPVISISASRVTTTERPPTPSTTYTTTTEEPTTTTAKLATAKHFSTTEGEHAFKLPFEAAFDFGKPVVSVSTTSSRFEVSSPRYETSTPKYGYFSVQYPSTTPAYERSTVSSTTPRRTTPPTTTKTTTETRPNVSSTRHRVYHSTSTELPSNYEYVYDSYYDDEDLASYLDSEDPFANIDWKKDNSGVTSNTRTRYESSFGSNDRDVSLTSRNLHEGLDGVYPVGRQRIISPGVDRTSSRVGQITPQKSTRVSSSSRVEYGASSNPFLASARSDHEGRSRSPLISGRSGGVIGRRRGATTREHELPSHQSRQQVNTQQPSPRQQDFSNFRYFKTAFGSTERPDQPESSRFPRLNSRYSLNHGFNSQFLRRSSNAQDNRRPQRTASQNTRYSIYG